MGWTWTISSSTGDVVSTIFPQGTELTVTSSDSSSTFTWSVGSTDYQMTLSYNSTTCTYSGTGIVLGDYTWDITITSSSGSNPWNAQLSGISSGPTSTTGSFVAQASTDGQPPGYGS